ncbi:hypothetical protein IAT38_007299 [Cryptococcus sp. DSM 104549]
MADYGNTSITHQDSNENIKPGDLEAGGGGYSSGQPMSRFVTPGGNPIDNSNPAFPVFHRKFGNAGALGLMSFAGASLLLNLFNLGARGVTNHEFILGMAFCYGGIGQTLGGIGEWAAGNTFAATALTSYGCFWFSFAVLYIPQFEVLAAYKSDPVMASNAMGLYLCCWGMVTFLFLVASLRSAVVMVVLFFFLDISFFCLGAGFLTLNETAKTAGAAIGLIPTFCGAYVALASLLTPETSYFMLPVGDLTPGRIYSQPH